MQIKDYRYVYNQTQAHFYMDKGLLPITEGINKKTNKIFYKFKDSQQLQSIFEQWCISCQNN